MYEDIHKTVVYLLLLYLIEKTKLAVTMADVHNHEEHREAPSCSQPGALSILIQSIVQWQAP